MRALEEQKCRAEESVLKKRKGYLVLRVVYLPSAEYSSLPILFSIQSQSPFSMFFHISDQGLYRITK